VETSASITYHDVNLAEDGTISCNPQEQESVWKFLLSCSTGKNFHLFVWL